MYYFNTLQAWDPGRVLDLLQSCIFPWVLLSIVLW